ncbi:MULTISPECIES: DUF2147 domain-containing protein [Methylobacterium]|uniref:DUF2147 domain-containing protein n=2 Tax=Pseudomonadota TaxID=1224 RepID=A0ABQ4SWI1_9HYPH|nr:MULTISPECIES: DUF2147 domain-containing protein [Methylobacterium]PIU07146.1 MAG: DUF2147 domain-containing protein [Methylobacterium sp. CG09_land_8_20_14_0_10_71_15]PIU15637.1 MAG: DUF2147 domain-containing protein [Methylobacterium sp. CG08_land_8_20_14_0_20_71_15]GBU18925.1 hypothetical protein AwMethylo_31400 [Methylobacterium sp.]GJE06290.1 hypothetical protein AOPFMNJM_1605 [Methylobacterium jeotgali]
MLKPRVLAAAALAALIATLPAAAQKGADASGLWLTQTGDSKVRLSRCGAGYCGVIASTSGKGIDEHNPDPALRGRSVVGVQIVNAPTASGEGYEGTLYNPKDGKTYSGSLKITGPGTIEVAGCVMGVFCKRQTWKKVN